MNESKAETYLGDVIENNTKAKANIEKRKARGYGVVNDILVITNEIPLSHWRIKAGLLLRQAMLVNGIMFNSEAWHNITDKDMMMLEKVDEALLRGLIAAHSKTPLEALYLETGSLPLRYILKSRRIMYLHNILKKEENELIRKIYETQKQNPSAGDFSELVRNDLTEIGMNMSDRQISQLNKQKFKLIVKNKIKDAALNYLKEVKRKHSKMQSLSYEIYQLQE